MKKAKRIEATYRFIVEFSEIHVGRFPSHKAIGAGIGVKSTSMIHTYIGELAKDGRVLYIDGVPCVAGARWLPPKAKP